MVHVDYYILTVEVLVICSTKDKSNFVNNLKLGNLFFLSERFTIYLLQYFSTLTRAVISYGKNCKANW